MVCTPNPIIRVISRKQATQIHSQSGCDFQAVDFNSIFVLFSGHGGSEAATFAKEHLINLIVNQKAFWSDDDEEVLRAIREGYLATHYAMWREQGKSCCCFCVPISSEREKNALKKVNATSERETQNIPSASTETETVTKHCVHTYKYVCGVKEANGVMQRYN